MSYKLLILTLCIGANALAMEQEDETRGLRIVQKAMEQHRKSLLSKEEQEVEELKKEKKQSNQSEGVRAIEIYVAQYVAKYGIVPRDDPNFWTNVKKERKEKKEFFKKKYGSWDNLSTQQKREWLNQVDLDSKDREKHENDFLEKIKINELNSSPTEEKKSE